MKYEKRTQLLAVAIVTVLVAGCHSGSSSGGASTQAPTESDPPLEPSNLICTSHTYDVFLSWINVDTYSEVRVSRDGVVVDNLAGTATSYSETLSHEGTYVYSVVGVSGDQASDAAACSVDVSSLAPVENLSCQFSVAANETHLSWSLPPETVYDQIRIYSGEALLGQISGQVTDYTDTALSVGSILYSVQGVAAGQLSGAAQCTVEVTEFGQITNLAATGNAANNTVDLTWHNGESYDEITVYCGGEPVATVGGTATSYSHPCVPHGVYDFSVEGTLGVRKTEPATCRVDGGQLVWDAATDGAPAAGYHVYVWEEGNLVPETDSPSYTTNSKTNLRLADLYDAGVLPESRTATVFNVAVAAYNDVATSELCTSILVDWQVIVSN